MKKYLILFAFTFCICLWIGTFVSAGCEEDCQTAGDGEPYEACIKQCAVTVNNTCLLGAGCKMDVYAMLGIRPAGGKTSVLTFVQDAILALTMFIGTVVTLAFIFSGLLFVFAAANPNLKQKARKGMVGAVIGMILVAGSYVIIRLIQYIAKGG